MLASRCIKAQPLSDVKLGGLDVKLSVVWHKYLMHADTEDIDKFLFAYQARFFAIFDICLYIFFVKNEKFLFFVYFLLNESVIKGMK